MNPFKCPKCGAEPNMIVKIRTEQSSRFYKKIPGRISINPKTSLTPATVDWDKVCWICPSCRSSGQDISRDCI